MTKNDLKNSSYLQLNIRDLDFKPQLDSLPVLLCGANNKTDATAAKEYLMQFFAEGTPALMYFNNKTVQTTLEKLDAGADFGQDCLILVIPEKDFDKKIYTFGDLIRILERLTGENGCPWDKEQTHESIRANMIEEAYEAALAITSGDKANFIEELGDVMLQSVFHADIARRSGDFDLSDIISALCRKLYTRHTHVFGDKKANSGGEALKNWEDAKAAEKGKPAGLKSYEGLPSLMRAQKFYKKNKEILQITQDIENKKDIFDGIKNKKDNNFDDVDFGQILFSMAAMFSDFGIDAENELNAYISKLINKHDGKNL